MLDLKETLRCFDTIVQTAIAEFQQIGHCQRFGCMILPAPYPNEKGYVVANEEALVFGDIKSIVAWLFLCSVEKSRRAVTLISTPAAEENALLVAWQASLNREAPAVKETRSTSGMSPAPFGVPDEISPVEAEAFAEMWREPTTEEFLRAFDQVVFPCAVSFPSGFSLDAPEKGRAWKIVAGEIIDISCVD